MQYIFSDLYIQGRIKHVARWQLPSQISVLPLPPPPISVLHAAPQIDSAQITAAACIWQWNNFSNISQNSLKNFLSHLLNLSNFIKVFSKVLQII